MRLDKRHDQTAIEQFDEWADALLIGEVIVTLTLYADESGTHDPLGNQPNSKVPCIAGYLSTREKWREFCPKWKSVLDRFGLKAFHATEIFGKRKMWKPDEFDSLIYSLAEVAGKNIPVGSAIDIKEHLRKKPFYDGYAYRPTIDTFFIDLVEKIMVHGLDREKIAIVFDINSSKKWNSAILEEIEFWKSKKLKITGFTYGDDEDFLPLQAADLIAHRSREIFTDSFREKQTSDGELCLPNVYDLMLMRNREPGVGVAVKITNDLWQDILRLSQKFSSVKRAMLEIPSIRAKLNERTKST